MSYIGGGRGQSMSRREQAEEERKRRKEEQHQMRSSRQLERTSVRNGGARASSSRRSTRSLSPSQSYEGHPAQAAYRQQQQQQQQYQQYQQQQHQQGYHQQGYQQPGYQQQGYQQQQGPPQETKQKSIFSKFKSVLSFSPHHRPKDATQLPDHSPMSSQPPSPQHQPSMQHQQQPAVADPYQRQGSTGRSAPSAAHPSQPAQMPASGQQSTTQYDTAQVRDLQHRISVLEAELQEVDEIKRQLVVEQRTGNEWKDKWNYQNFKLNLMVDMLVLRTLELDPAAAAKATAGPVQPGRASGQDVVAGFTGDASQGPRLIKRGPAVQQSAEIIEDSIEDW